MKNALLLGTLACALTFGGVDAQEAPVKATSVPVDASGKEAVTRTKSKPVTAGKQPEAPSVTAPVSEPPRAAPPRTTPGKWRDRAALVQATPGAPDAPTSTQDRPTSAPPPVRK
jgi:hypothetical protein